MHYMLQDLALVLDRVYYDHKTKQVNFRGNFMWSTEHQRPLFTHHGPHRMCITKDGTILNRG